MRTSLFSGALVGAVGTAAMDLLWYRRARARDGTSVGPFASWEFSTGADSFDDVGAPAKVAQRVAVAVHRRIPDRHAGLANDVVHWATGLSWGAVAAGLVSVGALPPFAAGVAAGVAAFGVSYALLAPLGVYDPIWEYNAATLWKDFSAHAVFGVVTGTALALGGSGSRG